MIYTAFRCSTVSFGRNQTAKLGVSVRQLYAHAITINYIYVRSYFQHPTSFILKHTCCTVFFYSYRTTYGDFPPEGILINLIGAFVVIHAGLTFYIVKNDSFKQTATSEEHQELLDRSAEGEAKE